MDPFSRRRFLTYLAGSPLFAAGGGNVAAWMESLRRAGGDPAAAGELIAHAAQEPALIPTARHALSVFDFEPVAKKKVPVAHWGYLVTGTDDDGTIQANRDGFKRFELRVRRLVDVSTIDPSIRMLDASWPTPIIFSPVSSQRAFHPEGEIAVARAAKANGNLFVVSTVSTTSVEDVTAARGAPVWFQLYHRSDWNQTRQIVSRAERAGCPAIVFTIDLLGGSNRETMFRAMRRDTRQCTLCHAVTPGPGTGRLEGRDNRRKPMLTFQPGDSIPEVGTPTWDFVKRLKDSTSMKVLLKGIVTREDAQIAIEHGVNGVIVSNHGGRAENSLRSTISCVSEVAEGVGGRAPVLVDGGFRRGTDIFKALALGATAVGVGRPYIWGLAAFGQEGVEMVASLLRRELELVMRQAGTVSVARITRDYVIARDA
jgi:4-hydroxymandelate oxidase